MDKNIKLLLVAILSLCTYVTYGQQNDTLEIKRNEKGKIEFAHFTANDSRKLKDGASFLKAVLKTKPEDDFSLIKESTDKYGVTHYRFQQLYKELKVEGAQYIVHGKNGHIERINGNFQDVSTQIVPSLSEEQALKKALVFINSTKYKWEDPSLEKWVKENTNNPHATYYPKGELLISKDYLSKTNEFKVAWKFTISSLLPFKEQLVYVNARTGEIMNSKSLIYDTNTTLTAETMYSGNLSITGDSFGGGSFRLRESRNSVNIQTFDIQNSFTTANAIDFTNNSTNWTTGNWTNIGADQVALDIHWASETVYDYWNNVHSRNSIDGSGIRILSYVHASPNGAGWNNAQWVGGSNNHYMRYGDGDGFNFLPLVSLDICSHEFGHGINEFTTDVAQGSNGLTEGDALNEGLSDIWAACVEHSAAPGKQTWLVGEEIFVGGAFSCIRNMENPKSTTTSEGAHPDTYLRTPWSTAGEPHFNSTILSHWFYLLSQGGSGTNDNADAYNVVGIGITDAARIVYLAETNYLNPGDNYSNARIAMIQAAIEIFGTGTCEEITVTSAWYAVGVGSAYSGNAGLSIAGDNSVCGTSNNYTISPSLPTAATVVWSTSSSGVITINSSTSTQTTITKNNNGLVTLTATVSNVCGTTITLTKVINIGTPIIGGFYTYTDYPYESPMGLVESTEENEVCFTTNPNEMTTTMEVTGATSVVWEKNSSTPSTLLWDQSGDDLQITFRALNQTGSFKITATNTCGDDSKDFIFRTVSCGSMFFSVSPNPTTGNVEVSSVDKKTTIKEIRIMSKTGSIIKDISYANKNTSAQIDISLLLPDIYYIQIFDGKKWTSKIISKK